MNLIDRIITLNDVQIQERTEIDVYFAKLAPFDEIFLFSLYLSLTMKFIIQIVEYRVNTLLSIIFH